MGEQRTGICRLCLQERDLCESHYLSKGLYKALRGLHSKNKSPLLVTGKASFRTSRQMTAKLLCSECEQLLSAKGERYTIRVMSNRRGFLLLETVQRLTPAVGRSEVAAYKCANTLSVDTGALAHFALGLLWKASIHTWAPAAGVLTDVHLGPYQEVIRGYLRGEAGFPSNVVVKITLCTDRESQLIMYAPTLGDAKGSKKFNYYEILAGGINFGILIGAGIPRSEKLHCCASSMDRWIFVRNCRERTLSTAFATRGSKVAGGADIDF